MLGGVSPPSLSMLTVACHNVKHGIRVSIFCDLDEPLLGTGIVTTLLQ
jgi:hypothetical protein